MPKGTETAGCALRSPAIKEEVFSQTLRHAFAGGMRNHDDGDSFWRKGMDGPLLPDCKPALQLLVSYDARKGRAHAEKLLPKRGI